MSTTIVVSPLGRQLENTGEVINLDIWVKDPAFFLAYDRIEVWRSVTEQSGPYSALTAGAVSTARVPDGSSDAPAAPVAGPSVALDTLQLDLLVNETDALSIVFSGTDPISYGDAATQVIAQGLGKVSAYVTAEGGFVVETTAVGTGASLRVQQSDAAAQLGLPIDELTFGRAARPNLIGGQSRYAFEDTFGSEGYHYKIRFRNASTNAVSEFSLPHSVGARVGTDPSNIICGQADLLQPNGKPLINQAVQVRVEFNGILVDGAVMAGATLTETSDVNGRVAFTLVRGQRIVVSVPGTSLYRTIDVPTDAAIDTFNLFDPNLGTEDVFKVQVPNIVVAERRSL